MISTGEKIDEDEITDGQSMLLTGKTITCGIKKRTNVKRCQIHLNNTQHASEKVICPADVYIRN